MDTDVVYSALQERGAPPGSAVSQIAVHCVRGGRGEKRDTTVTTSGRRRHDGRTWFRRRGDYPLAASSTVEPRAAYTDGPDDDRRNSRDERTNERSKQTLGATYDCDERERYQFILEKRFEPMITHCCGRRLLARHRRDYDTMTTSAAARTTKTKRNAANGGNAAVTATIRTSRDVRPTRQIVHPAEARADLCSIDCDNRVPCC